MTMCDAASLDYLVGDREHARGNGEAEQLGGLEVNDKLKLGRLHDWQVGRLLALENPAGIDAGLVIRIGDVGSITHQTAGHCALAPLLDRWDRMTRHQLHDRIPLTIEESVRSNDECATPLLVKGSELPVDLAFRARG